jgi:hypothetical protein
MPSPQLALAAYITAQVENFSTEVPAATPLAVQLYTAMGLGIQFALELAELEPVLAAHLLKGIHADAAGAADEWYTNARKFAALCTQ